VDRGCPAALLARHPLRKAAGLITKSAWSSPLAVPVTYLRGGFRPLTPETGVRNPYGAPYFSASRATSPTFPNKRRGRCPANRGKRAPGRKSSSRHVAMTRFLDTGSSLTSGLGRSRHQSPFGDQYDVLFAGIHLSRAPLAAAIATHRCGAAVDGGADVPRDVTVTISATNAENESATRTLSGQCCHEYRHVTRDDLGQPVPSDVTVTRTWRQRSWSRARTSMAFPTHFGVA